MTLLCAPSYFSGVEMCLQIHTFSAWVKGTLTPKTVHNRYSYLSSCAAELYSAGLVLLIFLKLFFIFIF